MMSRIRLFLPILFLAAALIPILWGGGCGPVTRTMPKIPFVEKKAEDFDRLFSVGGTVTEIHASANWKFLVVLSGGAEKGARRRLDLFNTEFQTPFPLPEEALSDLRRPICAVFDRKGEELFVVHAESNGQTHMRRVPLENKEKEENEPSVFAEKYAEIIPSPTADWLAVRGETGDWKLIDRMEPERIVVFPDGETVKPERKKFLPPEKTVVVRPLAFSPDGKMVATLAESPDAAPRERKKIVIWDLSVVRAIALDKAAELPLSAIYVGEFSVPEMTGDGLCVFSPDGRMLALRHKPKYVAVYQAAGGRLLSEFGEHKQEIAALAFSPSNTKLAVGTCGEYGRLVLWEVRKGKILRTLDDPDKQSLGVTALTFSPDGKLIWYGNNLGDIKEWQTTQ